MSISASQPHFEKQPLSSRTARSHRKGTSTHPKALAILQFLWALALMVLFCASWKAGPMRESGFVTDGSSWLGEMDMLLAVRSDDESGWVWSDHECVGTYVAEKCRIVDGDGDEEEKQRKTSFSETNLWRASSWAKPRERSLGGACNSSKFLSLLERRVFWKDSK